MLDTNLCVQKITKKKNRNKYKAHLMGLNLQKLVIPGPVLAVICGLVQTNYLYKLFFLHKYIICEVKVYNAPMFLLQKHDLKL